MAAPAVHVSPITWPVVTSGLFASSSGASGFVKIIAPLPSADASELPLPLTATTFAIIEEPHGRRAGL